MSRAHPFPPMVRWAVFPALAGLAGAAAGLVAASTYRPPLAPAWAGFGCGIASAGAFGAMLSRRAWICLLIGPPFALLLSASVFVVVRAYFFGGRQETALEFLADLLKTPHELGAFLAPIWASAAACHAAFRWASGPSWPKLLGIYVAAAAVAGGSAALLIRSSDRFDVGLLLGLLVAFQAPPFRAAQALAGRLGR